MRIKIRGGTARTGDPPLCHSCKHACIVKGSSLRDEIVETISMPPSRRRTWQALSFSVCRQSA